MKNLDTAVFISNSSTLTRSEQLLLDPSSDASLDELKQELNELAKLRTSARLAFCKRIAVAYMILVGHVPAEAKLTGRSDAKKFYQWCALNLRTSNDKPYSKSTLRAYVGVGFDTNPALALNKIRSAVVVARHKSHDDTKRGRLLGVAIIRPTAAIVKLPSNRKDPISSNISQEINTLMSAWEQASAQARRSFLYMITGQQF